MNDNLVVQIQEEAKRQERRKELISRLPRAWTGKDIMTTNFPPPRWSVNGLIPTGAILLSGIYKIGKSWLMLQLTNCVSRGQPFLGHEVNKGAVLYLALEDGPARLQRRACIMGIVLADNVTVFNSWLHGEDGIASLDAWLEDSPARLVIIDTLSRWQDEYRGTDIWARDTKRIADFKAIADKHDCTVLIVHHRSKTSREDIHQSVAGTNALQGAADASIILDKKRGEMKGKMCLLGRDIAEADIAVEFMSDICTWRAIDADPREILLTPERQAVLDTLRGLGGTAHTGAIAKAMGKSDKAVSALLTRLKDDGNIASTAYGTYTTISTLENSGSVGSSGTVGNELLSNPQLPQVPRGRMED